MACRTQDPPLLRVSGLSLWRERTILTDINWTVSRGEHWVILGANGSGKTSLLRTITGYFPPSRGAIELLDNHYGESNWPELRRRVGWVSTHIKQQIADGESALEVVASGPRAMINVWGTLSRKEVAKAEAILDEVDCAPLRDEPWSRLSQGERQRLLIGRALAQQPDLLFLDEPCAGLDPVARERFLRFLQNLTRRAGRVALILVTHHVEEIPPCVTHTLLLRAGRVLAQGSITTVLTSRSLSRAFDAPLLLRKRSGRHALTLREEPEEAML